MIIKNITWLAAVIAAAFIATGCEKKPAAESAAKTLATVNGDAITETDYETYRRLREQQLGPLPDKASEKKIVLDELTNRLLIAQHAAALKLDQQPEVAQILKRVRQDILIEALQRKTLADHPITDEELKKRFEAEAEKTHKTEYRVRHILVKNEDEAKSIIEQLGKKGNFAALAKQHSIDKQSAVNGGDLEWINQGMPLVPEFFDAVMKLKKGEYTTAPVKTDFGFHVIKVEDTRPLKIPTFEEFLANRQAKAGLTRRMQQEAINNLVKDLRAKAKIEIKE
jgi:peptidyl-prolyl cis-trans isomerase C